MALLFGRDDPDALYLGILQYQPSIYENLIKLFKEHSTTNEYFIAFLHDPEKFAKMFDGHYSWKCNKTDNYNLEDAIKNSYREKSEPLVFPIFIMRNSVWYLCNESDFVLVPCQ